MLPQKDEESAGVILAPGESHDVGDSVTQPAHVQYTDVAVNLSYKDVFGQQHKSEIVHFKWNRFDAAFTTVTP